MATTEKATKGRSRYREGNREVRTLKSGQVTYRYRWSENGKQRFSKTFYDEDEARRWWFQHNAAKDDGKPKSDAELTIRDLYKDWLVGAKGKPRSKASFERILVGHILPSPLGDVPLVKIKNKDINAYIAAKRDGTYPVAETNHGRGKGSQFKKKLAEKSIKTHIWIFFSLFEYAKYNDLFFGNNPAVFKNTSLEVQDDTVRKGKDIPRSDQQVLLKHVFENYPDFYPLVITLLRTGARWGEVTNLKWGDLNGVDGRGSTQPMMHIRSNVVYDSALKQYVEDVGKSKNAIRSLVLNDELVLWLNYQKLHLHSLGLPHDNLSRVFQTKGGSNLHISNFQQQYLDRWWYEIYGGRIEKIPYGLKNGQKAGTQRHYVRYHPERRWTVHAFRHSAVIAFINSDIKVNDLAVMVGHYDPAFTLSVYGQIVAGKEEREQGFPLPSSNQVYGEASRKAALRKSTFASQHQKTSDDAR